MPRQVKQSVTLMMYIVFLISPSQPVCSTLFMEKCLWLQMSLSFQLIFVPSTQTVVLRPLRNVELNHRTPPYVSALMLKFQIYQLMYIVFDVFQIWVPRVFPECSFPNAVFPKTSSRFHYHPHKRVFVILPLHDLMMKIFRIRVDVGEKTVFRRTMFRKTRSAQEWNAVFKIALPF